MPWYEDRSTDREGGQLISHLGNHLHNQDPYRCTLELQIPNSDVSWLKELYSPLLRWIDPVFQLVRINKEIYDGNWLAKPRCDETDASKRHQNLVTTQSLSVVLFLREDSSNQLTADVAKTYLRSPPWEFHHKIELASRTGLRTVAAQDYYECHPGLPLWTVCSVHYGNEQFRFNMFVKNFEEMKNFYGALTEAEISARKPGFCTFDLYSQPGLDVKLSLKYSPFLIPKPTKHAVLRFSVRDIIQVKSQLSLEVTYSKKGTWLTRDPDGNVVMLSRDDRDILRCVEDTDELTDVLDSGQWRKAPSDDDASWDLSCDSLSI